MKEGSEKSSQEVSVSILNQETELYVPHQSDNAEGEGEWKEWR